MIEEKQQHLLSIFNRDCAVMRNAIAHGRGVAYDYESASVKFTSLHASVEFDFHELVDALEEMYFDAVGLRSLLAVGRISAQLDRLERVIASA